MSGSVLSLLSTTNAFCEQSFECSICLEIFEQPRIIPCGHSFCGPPKNCLSKILQSPNRECPICKEKFKFKKRNSEVFPQNFSLIGAIENMRSKARTGNTGDICRKHALETDIFCRTCTEVVCKKCWMENHADSKDHQIVPFSNYKKERISQEMQAHQTPISEIKMENIRIIYEEAMNDFVLVGDKLQEVQEQSCAATSLQKRVLVSKSDQDFEANLEEFRLSLKSQAKLVEDFQARIEVVKASLDRAQSYLVEGVNVSKAVQSPSLTSEGSRIFDSSSSDEEPVNMTRSIDMKLSHRLASIVVKASSPVKIEGSKPLLRAVVDATSTVFCLSWFNVIYTLKAVESGFISKSLCLKREVRSCYYWSTRQDGTILRDIAVSNNTLYGVTMEKNFTWNVEVLNKHSFHSIRKVNTQIIPQPGSVNGWQIAGNFRILIIRSCESNTLYVFENERFRDQIQLALDQPSNWFSFTFSNDHLMLQNFVDKQLVCIKWEERTQLNRSKLFRQKSYLNGAPILKHIDESDSPVMVLNIDSMNYALSRSSCYSERLVTFHHLTNLLEVSGTEALSGENVRPYNNDVLGQYDEGKLGLSLLCIINRSTVLCQEKFRDEDDYSLYLLTAKVSGIVDGKREFFYRSTSHISNAY